MPPQALGVPDDAGAILLPIARAAIEDAVGAGRDHADRRDADQVRGEGADPKRAGGAAQWLLEPGACFVTLTQSGALRGCIGSVEAWRPLGEDVRSNAVAAALKDRRFAPLRADELAHTDLEVSVLSPPEPMDCPDEAAALATLRPGVDGVVLVGGGRRATFLPQVWEKLPEPAAFLGALRRKAGLPASYWGPDVTLSRYTVTAWEEHAP